MSTVNTYQRIYDAAKKFLVPLDNKQAYMTVVKEALRLVNGMDGSIFIFENGKPKRAYTTNKKLNKVIPRSDGITYEVYTTQLPRLRHREGLVDANSDFRTLPYQSDICVPLNYGHITIGVLSILSHHTKKFSDEDLGILTLFAPLATLALYNAQLHHEAQRSINTRDLFISMAAHELKNPLTLIKLNAQLLDRNKEIRKMSEYKRIKSILKGVERLDSLTTELLQVDRTRTGKLMYEMNKINIVEVVKQAVDDSKQRFNKCKFTFNNMSGKKIIKVNGDEDKLLQVFINLINNAVKFSPQKSEVQVVISLNDKEVQIDVIDKGVGISADVLPQLFTKFFRGSSKKEGMGLGLYLVKQIINKHQGDVTIESQVNKGTKVSVVLPLYKENEHGNRATGK